MAASESVTRIAVLMATFNRCEQTMASLESIATQKAIDVNLDFFIVDDGSSDGTPTRIKKLYPEATILQGSGALYWAASMALAERVAAASNPDYYLWLNDDTVLQPDALSRMLGLSQRRPSSIVVGATTSLGGAHTTYGGRFRAGWNPMRFTSPEVRRTDQRVDSFNGNCVLIPKAVRDIVGPIDGLYAHAFADDDYAYRAGRYGISKWQVAGSVGTCEANHVTRNLRFLEAFRLLRSPKGLPLRSHARFLRRHAGWEWPLWVISGQLGFLYRAIKPRPTDNPTKE